MDFMNLAEIFENRASSIRQWAQCEAEYKIAEALEQLAKDIREEVNKESGD